MHRGFFEGLLEILGTATAAVIVPAVTFGWARVDLSVRPKRMPWHDMRRDEDGTWLVGQDLGAIVGILSWGALIWGITELVR